MKTRPVRSLVPLRRRRLLLTALLAWPARALAVSAEVSGRHARLMAEAEQALEASCPRRAADLFEQASRLDDVTPDAELGLLRAWLHQGDYAHAAAWGRLVAGEHADAARARAWATDVEALAQPQRHVGTGAGASAGARASSSSSSSSTASARANSSSSAKDTATATTTATTPAATSAGTPLPSETSLPPPAPRRPTALPAAAALRPCARGLIDASAQRLRLAPDDVVALARLPVGTPLWATDGTGQLLQLTPEGLALSGDTPGADEPAWQHAAALRAAPAVLGRPVLMLETSLASTSTAACQTAWPRLRTGLLTFPAPGRAGLRIDLPGPTPVDGSPVFDLCGDWLGWIVASHLLAATEVASVPAPLSAGAVPSLIPPAPSAPTPARAAPPSGCRTVLTADVRAVYARWFARSAVVWRLA